MFREVLDLVIRDSSLQPSIIGFIKVEPQDCMYVCMYVCMGILGKESDSIYLLVEICLDV